MKRGGPLGWWVKLYVDITERKTHYSDAQFRSLIELLCLAGRSDGHLPPRRALDAREGRDNIDFLFQEGDLDEMEDGSVVIGNWETYQRPTDNTAAERQARKRERDTSRVTARDVTRDVGRDSGVTSNSLTESMSTNGTEDEPLAGAREDWAQLMELSETATGRPYALGSQTGKLGEAALAQVADFGFDATKRAWLDVVAHRPDPNVRLSIGQVLWGADNLLRPIPKVNGKAVAAEEEGRRDREASERRRAATRKLIDEQKAREH